MGSPACTYELLSHGANPNLVGPSQISPLMAHITSCTEPTTMSFELLIRYGAHLDPDMLFKAVAPRIRQGELKTAFFLSKGIAPTITSAKWGMPLHQAVRSGKPGCVKLLLDAGADPTAKATGKGFGKDKTPLEVAEQFYYQSLRDSIIDLIVAYITERSSLAEDRTEEGIIPPQNPTR